MLTDIDLTHVDKTRFRGQKVGVVTGGQSSEREISLKTGRGFAEALRALGYDTEVYDVPGDFARLAQEKPAAVILGLHGGAGENGVLQGYLEALGIPYTGSGVLASALAMDKGRAKAVLRDVDVPTPAGLRLAGHGELDFEAIEAELELEGLELPLVVKPNDEGSSVGVHLCREETELAEAIESLWNREVGEGTQAILIEQFLDGAEYTVGFFDEICLGSIEVTPGEQFYDFKAKYESSETRYETVEEGGLKSRLESIGRDAYNALGCRGVARVDIKANRGPDELELYVLEVNTIPGMTATSLVPKLAGSHGISFEDFTEYMLASASCEMQR
ncbi:D-alanine--D-alanine ligase [Persicimonas caeni]|uniref:D-alanine--D-alanine ligase n=1 Tax=Persicimonas caeni TaxID=2292766 RepID=A0A4Y6Q2U2_PERCE|nr:D-alanine--D-alanine ligase [Persicimonas caeni]QDG54770.1 D-alanine--D-alanine ligase [Persicimonas caeni]QED35991.1 D-alanine--D-alanine ligase [Persicimonas caeni]